MLDMCFEHARECLVLVVLVVGFVGIAGPWTAGAIIARRIIRRARSRAEIEAKDIVARATSRALLIEEGAAIRAEKSASQIERLASRLGGDQ